MTRLTKLFSLVRISTLGTKLAVALSLPVAIISIFIFLFFPAYQRKQLTEWEMQESENTARVDANALSFALRSNDIKTIQEILRGIENYDEINYLIVVDTLGNELGEYYKDNKRLPDSAKLRDDNYISEDNSNYHCVAQINYEGINIGKLYLGHTLQEVDKEVAENMMIIMIISISILILGALASYALSSILTRPLRKITETAKHISEGDLSRRVSISTKDEIGNLANSFNPMVNNLESANGELKLLNTELELRIEKRIADLLQEIASHKRTEEALRESEERYMVMTKNTGQIVYDFNIRTGEISRTGAIEEITGYTDDEYNQVTIGRWKDLLHKDDIPQAVSLLEKAIRNGTNFFAKYRLKRKDGKYIYIEDNGTCLKDRHGTAYRMLGTMKDVTERVEAEEALRESEKSLNDAQRLAHIGSWSWIVETDEVRWSKELYEITGENPQLFSPTYAGLAFLYTKESWETLRQAVERAISKGMPYEIELDMVRPDGEIRYTNTRGEAIKDESGRVVRLYGTVQDITEHKLAEKEKSQLEAQLHQTQKMEAIGTLAGGIAHDFNNILTAIIGYTEFARDSSHGDSDTLNDLDEVMKAANRAKNLVQQILTFSHRDEISLQPIDIRPVVKEALKLLRATLPTTISFQQHINTNGESILADPTQIHQILMNLCTNAYHAMQETGGNLAIELKVIEVDANFVAAHQDLKEGKHLQLTVSDTGHGMDQATMERIFEPFFTTKKAGQGTGMGLSTVHGIVKKHGGIITVYSEPQKGATFSVYFPVISRETETNDQPPEPTSYGNERILLVDDEEQVVELGKRMLGKLGYQATATTSSMDAMETFRTNPDDFDLIITNITMPKMTGLTLAKEAMNIRPDIPIIFMTGFSELITSKQAEQLGIAGYISKPLNLTDFSRTLRRVLDQYKQKDAAVSIH
ncbi:MAG: hypothetical protein CO189_02815 [candidate division Zixibacteria bacterium CG_4_9_14_3_um_filter_46_8]|nr:MAG: hypothetical protein CO189_02815 [candidate division Zixibacteria bacterium CG_4_9_14_3_um_filter_46_8]